MPGRKTGRARDYGLERTDNDMAFTSWPQVNMVNQKNYYTEYLKRDEQILALRLQNEENRNQMVRAARDRDRALAHSARNDGGIEMEIDAEDQGTIEDPNESTAEAETLGSKVVVIHPGSQNLRIGLASDVLPKTVPMVIARRFSHSECEEPGSEPKPKRRKTENESSDHQNSSFDEEFIDYYNSVTTDLKTRMKKKQVRSVPTAREQAVIFNKRTPPESIPQLNDAQHIDWTEVVSDNNEPPDYFTGQAALRLPDTSEPRYKLFWPLRGGVFNEKDYTNQNQLLRDFTIIIEEALKKELGFSRKSELSQYGCVFVIPDLYERSYVTTILNVLFRDMGFSHVCFIQESLSASFGAGYSTCCIVDVGAQKTSICCVDEGMCVENSRVNLRYGGADVTETFVKMMLQDGLPYADINLLRRHDFILAEELKQTYCTLYAHDIANAQLHDFYLRVHGQDTRHYQFKVFDEIMLAPLGYFYPMLFDNSEKLVGRRKLIGRSYDLYDGSPNDPLSPAQTRVLQEVSDKTVGLSNAPENNNTSFVRDGTARSPPPSRKPVEAPENGEDVLQQDNGHSPGQEDRDTPQLARAGTPAPGEKETPNDKIRSVTDMIRTAEQRDQTLPIVPLSQAINFAIEEGAKGDDRKTRDFFGGILCVGGGVLTKNFHQFLEEELLASHPKFKKEMIVSLPPRDIDPQVLVWKGASVFGKLKGTNDSWISRLEHNLLNSRILTYKCLWNW